MIHYASPCCDCGIDTTPPPPRKRWREGIAAVRGKAEWYMVTDNVWTQAKLRRGLPSGIFICIGCLETRLGRRLQPEDFTDALVNDPRNLWHTPRLLSRLLGDS